MERQILNIRTLGGWFLGTIDVASKTPPDQTAKRIQRYIETRHNKRVTVHPVINR